MMRGAKAIFAFLVLLAMEGCAFGHTGTRHAVKEYSLCAISSLSERVQSESFITQGVLVRSLHFNTALESESCPGVQYIISIENNDDLNAKWTKIINVLWGGDRHGFINPNVRIEIKVQGHAKRSGALGVIIVKHIINYKIFRQNK